MEKKVIGIIVAIMSVIGATLLLVGCVGKDNKVSAPPDITITNSLQLKDISGNAMIHNEARQRLINVMLANNLRPDGSVDFVKVLAYNTFNGHHYLALEFKTRIIGDPSVAQAIAYLNVRESSGQYTVVDSWYTLSSFPETDQPYRDAFDKILDRVKTCDGLIPVATTEQ